MSENKQSRIYNLEERTAKFGEEIICFCKSLHRDSITNSLIVQLIKSATSIGANYCEADDAESKADFKHKIGICKKESREVKHWLRMIAIALPNCKEESRAYWLEAKELNLIFNAINNKLK